MSTFESIQFEIQHNLKLDFPGLNLGSRFKEDLNFGYAEMATLIDCLEHTFLMNLISLEMPHARVAKIKTVQDLVETINDIAQIC